MKSALSFIASWNAFLVGAAVSAIGYLGAYNTPYAHGWFFAIYAVGTSWLLAWSIVTVALIPAKTALGDRRPTTFSVLTLMLFGGIALHNLARFL